MKNISRILLVLSLLLVGCQSVRIPKSIDKAKNRVERNVREINAIVEYHSLASPLVRHDTLTFVSPETRGRLNIPLKNDVGLIFDQNIFPVFIELKDTVEVERIRDRLVEASRVTIDTTYEDSVVVINVFTRDGELVIDYNIKSQTYQDTISTEYLQIDTTVKWYEDRWIKLTLFLLVVAVLIIIIVNLTKRKGGG
jgi:hypothetical protein